MSVARGDFICPTCKAPANWAYLRRRQPAVYRLACPHCTDPLPHLASPLLRRVAQAWRLLGALILVASIPVLLLGGMDTLAWVAWGLGAALIAWSVFVRARRFLHEDERARLLLARGLPTL